MGIFTSQKRSLQDLPKPSSLEFGSVKDIKLPEIKNEISSVSLPLSKEDFKVKKHIFVKMEQYKEAVEIISKIREKIRSADAVLNDLRNIKSKEDEHLDKWHRDLEIIKEKLTKMDDVLYNIEHE